MATRWVPPLGAPIEAVHAVMVDDWATGLIRSWDDGWLDLPQRAGVALAPLLGADGEEVIVHDSTSVNLFQLVHAALALRPDRRVIAVDPTDFPTDLYVVDGIAARTGHAVRSGFERLDDVAVVVRTLVDYRTADIADLAGETARATAAGALVVWDLSHAVGLLELDLHDAGVDLAVGCTYKYLGSGPGGPAFSYVARGLQTDIDQPIWGWFGRSDQFAMAADYAPMPGIGRLLIGTPGIIGVAAAKAAIEVVADAGIGAIRAKATALTGLALDLCAQHGLESPTPRDPAATGRPHRGAPLRGPSPGPRPGGRGDRHRLPGARPRPTRLLAPHDPLHGCLRRRAGHHRPARRLIRADYGRAA